MKMRLTAERYSWEMKYELYTTSHEKDFIYLLLWLKFKKSRVDFIICQLEQSITLASYKLG